VATAGAAGAGCRSGAPEDAPLDLSLAARRDVTVPGRLEADSLCWKPSERDAPYTFPWAWQGRPSW